ncbi:xanthine dehydrogenase molybdopterin binding subunit [Methylovirgula sp. 4M-Z18]|uniref:xanthine dehydrogenase molybdopterin binding subunit n=1 Tax=Methylovirgula sp. 4M-Z18 TaxID=2293567 RepID=UPI000E2E4C7D|nr:xanthine dehydrogenase molybdopterin binding subunit [Methylovirgula sp. 4M-Z18]RFB80914.1 xanthine dehydrogenase molybdopterin binding subunit [Methylovirgula sp. 4M-Z18]
MHKPSPQIGSNNASVRGAVHVSLRHDSAHKHVAGEAVYIDDMPEPAGMLHAYFGLSDRAHARIVSVDLEPVRKSLGVVMVLTAADLPGVNDVSPVNKHDEPLLAADTIEFHGQPIFAVAATTRQAARYAAAQAIVTYEDLPAALDVDAARAMNMPYVTEPLTLNIGDTKAALAAAPRRLSGRLEFGGQDHFYLEGHIAVAEPGEDEDVKVYSSTQHPSEVQHMVAHILGISSNAVTVETRRMGGGFGGKETQGNQFACIAAIIAKRTGRAVKIRPDRDDDMVMTGKRHDFVVNYDVGFDDTGRIHGVDVVFAARCGFAADLSGPVTDRALFHADNAYYYPSAHLTSQPLKTNTVSNTAFRGFGGPQGMMGAERMIEEIAFALGKDPLDIRKVNFYGTDERNVTPYHQTVTDNIIADVVAELEKRCDYAGRRRALAELNAKSPVIKRGIALTPVKFGISFTATHYNQAGALVHIYSDGSVHLNHGGTEMGQGLYTKVAQVVAQELQIDIDHVKITATTTAKVPNTSATAASSGADLNGKAAQAATHTLKKRLVEFAAEKWAVDQDQVVFLPNRVRVGNQEIPFPDFVKHAYMARVSLSATGFYKTPKIHWDRASGRGRPFYYYAYGAACSLVAIDTLTGEYRIERVDILHDAGNSLNPSVDIGQIEGGFVQGAGWLTTEELVWDDKGRLRTHAPSTYKIPACGDRPRIFNVELFQSSGNREEAIFRSKAVGEPPFMLGLSVWQAISDAVASVAEHRVNPRLDCPATPERVLAAVERVRAADPIRKGT